MLTPQQVQIEPTELHALASIWRHQEWDVLSARDALAAVPVGALATAGVGGFLAAWAAEIGGLAGALGSVADGLAAAGSDFVEVDGRVAER